MKTEIVTSRKKTILLLLGSLVVVVGGVFAPQVSYWADVFFAMCSIAFVAMLFRPYRLILDNKGLTLSGGFRSPWKIAWRDVDRFFVSHPRLGVTVIRFNYSADASKKPRGKRSRAPSPAQMPHFPANGHNQTPPLSTC